MTQRADWAVWQLPGGPVGPASRWATTSNVEVGETNYPVKEKGMDHYLL